MSRKARLGNEKDDEANPFQESSNKTSDNDITPRFGLNEVRLAQKAELDRCMAKL